MQYYAPVPQVDRGHQSHLGAGVVQHLQVQEVHQHILHLKEKDSATVHLNCCNFHVLFQIFIAQSICMMSNWGKTMKTSKAMKKILREDSETLSIATALLSIVTTKSYLLYNMYSAILRNIPSRCPCRMVPMSMTETSVLFILVERTAGHQRSARLHTYSEDVTFSSQDTLRQL